MGFNSAFKGLIVPVPRHYYPDNTRGNETPRTGKDTNRSRKPADARVCLTTLSLVAGILPCPTGRVVSSCPLATERSIVQ